MIPEAYDDSAISGYFETRVDANESDIVTVSGLIPEAYDDSAISGYFETRVDANESDIVTVSGLIPEAYDDSAISGYFETRVDANESDIVTVSGLIPEAYDDSAISGYFETRVDANESDIVVVSGLVDQNAADIIVVSGLTGGGGGGVNFFPGSGLTMQGSGLHVYGGSGHFVGLQNDGVTTLNSGIKTVLNKEVDATTITFDMDTANTHSVTLGGNRTLGVSNVDAGQKFSIRIKQDDVGSRLVSSWWSNISWLTADGSEPTLKTSPSGIDYFTFICSSGGFYDGFHVTEESPSEISSGIAVYASGLAEQNAADIVVVSGLIPEAYDDSAISGYFETRVDTNESDIVVVSGLVDQNAADIIVVSGLTGDVNFFPGSGLTMQGSGLHVYGGSGHFINLELETIGTGDLLTLISTEDGSDAAPVISTMRDSASPADGDYLGQLKFKGRSDTGTERVYAKITGKTLDVTNGAEDGLIEFAVRSGGSQEIISRIRNDGWRILNDNNLYIQDNGSLGVRVDPTYSLHVKDDAYIGSGVTFPDVTPASTDNKLYNEGTQLHFNGSGIPFSHPVTNASGVNNMMIINSGDYTALASKDPNTIYFLV